MSAEREGMQDECWMIWVRPARGAWWAMHHTASCTRSLAIEKFDRTWVKDGEYARRRRKGKARALRTTLTTDGGER